MCHASPWNVATEERMLLIHQGDDRNICMLDASRWASRGTRPQVERFPAHRKSITCVQACPDNRNPAVVSTAWDRVVKVWDYRRQVVLQTFSEHAGAVTGVAFDPDGQIFVTVGADAMIHMYTPVHDLGPEGAENSAQPGAPEEDAQDLKAVKVKPG